MAPGGLLRVLVLFILFVTVQGPGLSDRFFPKKCPRIREQCEFRERDLCTKDRQCPHNQRCCVFSCGRKCLDLQQESCPKVRVKCEIEERNLCTRHRQCPNNMKCCMFSCGKKCLDMRKDICSMPKEVGPCMAYLPRWWYNEETQLCSRFIYGGCQGNNNNFQSEAICMVVCQKSYD